MKKFNCIFPGLYNYILTKDVGMIPYKLSSSYESILTTYPNEEFTYMDNILKSENFKINYLEKSDNERKDVVKYIRQNAETIDILQLYHLRYNLLPYYILSYKLHNRNGKIYLKLDANNEFVDFLVKRKGLLPSLRRLYVKILFKFINLVSIETNRNYHVLLESNLISKQKLLYLPNGILKTNTNITNKEHYILYVGHIEKQNKSIDMLIKAINNIEMKDWKLILVGNIKEDMKKFIDEIFKNNKKEKERAAV